MKGRVVGAAILMAWFIAAMSAGVLGARIVWLLEPPLSVRVVTNTTIANDGDVWFNPRWTRTHEARPWIWGSRSYTTRDLMGRSI
jgi:hypothetical protein